MHLIELSDATSFLDRTKDFLLESEAENNLLLSSAWTLAKNSATRSSKLSFFISEAQGKTVGAALNSSERRLLLSETSPEVAQYMGHELAHRQAKIRGVLGPAPGAAIFAAAFASAKEAVAAPSTPPSRFCPRFHQKIMRLETPLEYAPAFGLLRVAKEKDAKLLLKWSRQFVEECGLDETPLETEEVVRRYLENRQLFIWEDSRPVAMAGYGGITPNGVRVNMVYTDPSQRSKGYAGSLVHILSRKLLAEGHRFCFLFTDATNPVSNRVYERLGYRAVCDFTEFRA